MTGMELAANFSDKASSVTCVGRTSIPFANVLGEKIGSMLKKVAFRSVLRVFSKNFSSWRKGKSNRISGQHI